MSRACCACSEWHKRKDIDDISHVTMTMRDRMIAALQDRWDRSGGRGVAQILDAQPLDTEPDAA